MDSLVRVLIGVGVNVGPYSRQLNWKHKLKALKAHDMTEDGQQTFLSIALCFAGKAGKLQQGNISMEKINNFLGKLHSVYM